MMQYKGYTAKVRIDEEQRLLHGEVLDLVDVITFEGRDVENLIVAFHDSIDDYLAYCEERGEQPEKPFSGRFMVRIDPELHRNCSIAARLADKSLNAWVADALAGVVRNTRPAESVLETSVPGR